MRCLPSNLCTRKCTLLVPVIGLVFLICVYYDIRITLLSKLIQVRRLTSLEYPIEPTTTSSTVKSPNSDATTTTEKALPEAFHYVYTTNGLDPRYPVPPGDMGVPVQMDLNDTKVLKMKQDGMWSQGLNQYASDLMSPRRRLPDIRAKWCKEPGRYPPNLPPTSIVIVFFNEAWSVLIRTVHSILDRSPPELIKEIVLMDDYSYLPHLKAQLEDYFKDFPKVRILRAPKRLGLIRARMMGAKNTTTDLITFLDAHVECTVGWLEALLDPVVKNSTTIAIPTIDWIDENNMKLRSENAPVFIGAYDWDLNFGWWGRWSMVKKYENKFVPFDTPAMAGGLFAINRTFFERIGWYDDGFDIYGIENIELSMKSWMCGGKMVTVPCSRVAHIQKAGHPYLITETKDVIKANSIRLAEVWMDEYKHVIFDIYGIPHYLENEYGSVEERKSIRQRANCKTFRYYVDNAFPEMKSPGVPGAFRGEMKNVALGNSSCLEYRKAVNVLEMAPCNGLNTTQFWTHNYYEELNSYKACIDFLGDVIGILPCHRCRGNQAWKINPQTQQIESTTHKKCLAVDMKTNKTLITEECDVARFNQKWSLSYIELDVTPFAHTPAP